ncbi:MAG: DNA topoisomerase 3 [Mangrovibacterium sp.]
MKLCIAEKPSVAGEIAQILGARTRKDGYYEGNGYQVSWTFGHLCTLKEPADYTDAWKYWNMASLPMIPDRFGIKVMDDKGVQKQFKTLEYLISNASEVINCGDAGQEGELIQRWVLVKAGNKAPLKRLWISSLTEEAIREGFQKILPGEDFDLLYQAGSARAIGDWLLGLNATRVYTLKYGQNRQVLSIGRVQTPTLAMIVDRQLEIENFVPVPFWEIKTTYRDTVFSAASGRFEKPEDAKRVLDEISGEDLVVQKIITKKGKEYAPKLFDLTSLQVECNKKLNLTADETLRTIQSLYEKKVATYPRVDTTFLSDDIYKKVPQTLQALKDYQPLIAPLLDAKPLRKSKKVFDNKKMTDHHAIIPTGQTAHLTDEERRMYDMIVRRFIAVFYPDCEVSNTTVDATVLNHKFKATGKQILSSGWRKVFGEDGIPEDKILPHFQEKEQGPHTPDLQEKQTQPPQYFTEATLLRAMETAGKAMDDEEIRELMKENGIGRPSTRANIIETLFRRRFIQRERKRITATATGIDLIQTIENDLLKSAELTGQWERKLRLIENGELDMQQFMVEMKTMVWELIQQVKQSPKKEIAIQEEEKKPAKPEAKENKPKAAVEKQTLACPKCGTGEILKGKAAWGCSQVREKSCDFIVPFEQFGKKITQKQFEMLIGKKKTSLIKGFKQNDIKLDGKLQLNADYSVILDVEIKDDTVCPSCGQGKILRGSTAFGCSNFRGGCNFRMSFEVK